MATSPTCSCTPGAKADMLFHCFFTIIAKPYAQLNCALVDAFDDSKVETHVAEEVERKDEVSFLIGTSV